MDGSVNSSFTFNQETEFVPILGQIASQLNEKKEDKPDDQHKSASSIQANHHSSFLSLLAGELSVAPEEIHDFELKVISEFSICDCLDVIDFSGLFTTLSRLPLAASTMNSSSVLVWTTSFPRMLNVLPCFIRLTPSPASAPSSPSLKARLPNPSTC